MAPCGQTLNLLPVGGLAIPLNESYHCSVIRKFNDGVGGMEWDTVIEGIQERTEHAALG